MKVGDDNRVVSDQIPLLDSEPPSLSTLPNPKLQSSDLVGVHGWTRFYAAFSERFARYALDALSTDTQTPVLDPFVGSGTVLVSALKKGIPAVGADLDPFACLLSRSKVAIRADRRAVRDLLRGSTSNVMSELFPTETLSVFTEDCLRYASVVFSRVGRRVAHDRSDLLNFILSDSDGEFDSEAVALASLCIAASKTARLIMGSNPTWYRNARAGEAVQLRQLREETHKVSKIMLNDLEAMSASVPTDKRSIRIVNSDVAELSLELVGVQPARVVTSPPYLTRMDYVVKHLPNLLLLAGLTRIDLPLLRKRMMGTAKIIDKSPPSDEWGPTCVRVLERIAGHNSYASHGYYVWTYIQYFRALHNALSRVMSITQKSTEGLFVVQDTFYKELRVELSTIVLEMFEALGVDAVVARRSAIKPNLKQINPARKAVNPQLPSTEDVIHFRKA